MTKQCLYSNIMIELIKILSKRIKDKYFIYKIQMDIIKILKTDGENKLTLAMIYELQNTNIDKHK